MLQRVQSLILKHTVHGPGTRLHRWCIPSSPMYHETCDTMRKGGLADVDNSVWPFPAAKADRAPPETPTGDRDAATALFASWHG